MMRKYRPGDEDRILEGLRPEDIRRLECIGPSARQVIQANLRASSRAWVGVAPNAEIGVLFGVVQTSLIDLPYLWLIPTRHIDVYAFLFLRQSRRLIGALRRTYGAMHCHCDIHFPRSVRWIKWLGFVPSGETIALGSVELHSFRCEPWPR